MKKPVKNTSPKGRGPSALGVIPARMASSRFPGKPLASIKGMPMIWHVWKRSSLSRRLDRLVIATCDPEIRAAAEAFGAEVVMTSDRHTRSNDRVAEAAGGLPGDLILNIQGDEPLVHPRIIDDIVREFERKPGAQCINPVAPLKDAGEIASPNTVKVVYNLAGRALYFSRYPIPSDFMARRKEPVYRQVPILGFRRDFLLRLCRLPETPLEKAESVDLLRAVEHGLPVDVVKTEFQTIGVDTPGDVALVERALEVDPLYERCRVQA